MLLKKIILSFLLLTPFTVKAQGIPLENPLQAESIPELAGQMINGMLGVTGGIALFMLVLGGVMWMISGGNADKLKKGKDTILWAILGLVIIFMSYIVLNFVFSIIGENA